MKTEMLNHWRSPLFSFSSNWTFDEFVSPKDRRCLESNIDDVFNVYLLFDRIFLAIELHSATTDRVSPKFRLFFNSGWSTEVKNWQIFLFFLYTMFFRRIKQLFPSHSSSSSSFLLSCLNLTLKTRSLNSFPWLMKLSWATPLRIFNYSTFFQSETILLLLLVLLLFSCQHNCEYVILFWEHRCLRIWTSKCFEKTISIIVFWSWKWRMTNRRVFYFIFNLQINEIMRA